MLAMRCALEFMGPDHLLIGMDYAHPIGGPDRAVGFVMTLEPPDAQREKIPGKHAAGLLKLDL